MNNNSTCVFVCNKLLRGEISAIESYQEALGKFERSGDKESLHRIMEDHRKSADALREHILAMGAVPDSDSGAWGSFAQSVTDASGLLGLSTVVSTLITGEEHGVSEYEDALNDPDVMNEIKIVFRDTLLPRLQKHIALLENIKS